jgi:hypothetical protein
MKTIIGLTALIISSTSLAEVFQPDRQYLFSTCAKINGYDVDKPYGTAIRRGSWAFDVKKQQGATIVLDAWSLYGDNDPNHLAYVLATARRESAGTFFPIREAPKCGSDEECRERAIGRLLQGRADKRNADRQLKGFTPLPVRENYSQANKYGLRYYGRGFNQLTGPDSYKRAGRLIGIDLVAHPDKALDPPTSARILIEGMLKGWFGSRKSASYYLDQTPPQWKAARATTNPGSPNADITAAFARDFRKCLRPST